MYPDLQTIGLTAEEAELYALLVDSPPLTREEVRQRWDRPDRQASPTLLTGLGHRGLLTTLAGDPERVGAIAPDVALAELAERRIADLTQARDRVTREFRDRWVQGEHGVDARDVIEIVVGRSAIHQRVRILEREAREIIGFDRPPYAAVEMVNPVENRKLQEGCVYRSIYEGSSLDLPGQMESIQEAVGLGEQARVLWGVPMKMVMADRNVAVVPLETSPDTIDVAAVVHPSSLLVSLHALFELLWEQATPLGDPRADSSEPTGATADRDQRQAEMLTLMAAGLPDKSVARQLGVTERTVQRWIHTLMTEHSAHTRFQLGLKINQAQAGSAS